MKGRLAFCPAPKQAFEIELFDVALPQRDEILVRVEAAGICGSDLHMWHGDVPFLTTMPAAPGHEMVGRIHALGGERRHDSLGRPLREGDRVTYAYFTPCGTCWPCVNGNVGCPNRYRQRASLSAFDPPHFHGAYGDYYYVKGGQWIFKVPDSIPNDVVVPANCALAQVTQGLDRARVRLSDSVVIQGLGGLGIYACALARDLGAGAVVGIDGIPERLELARSFGASAVIDITTSTAEERLEEVRRLTSGHGADIVVELAGVPQVVPEGIDYLRPGGRYILIGNVQAAAEVTFRPHAVIRTPKELIGVVTYDQWVLPRALDWLERRQDHYPFDRLVSQSFTLESLTDAFRAADWAAAQGHVGRVVIDMGAS
ncbi:MAG: zinc-binding dehydrogenase [Candidatus Dormibacteria bacterium]